MQGPASPSADPRVQEAIQTLYRVFSAPTPRTIDGCPCCIGTRRVDTLLSKPLNALSGQDLWRYTTGAFLTLGSREDFRYLLPRMLEIAICDPSSAPDEEIILGKLRLAGWDKWPAKERKAVEALIDVWFEHTLASDLLYLKEGVPAWDVEGLLCGAARADLDLSRWLARLGEPAAEGIRASIADRRAKALIRADGPPRNSFWEDAPEGWRALAEVLSQA